MKCRNFIESFSHALDGIVHTINNERNMKIHIVAAFLVICAGVVFKISAVEYALIFLAIGLVIVSEIVNTAVEIVVDMLAKGFDAKAKIAKDVAAGSSLMASFIAILIGISIFGWRLLEWIKLL